MKAIKTLIDYDIVNNCILRIIIEANIIIVDGPVEHCAGTETSPTENVEQ